MSNRRGRPMPTKLQKGELQKSWKKIGASMKKYYGWMIAAFVAIIFSVLLSIYSPQVLKDLTNDITTLNESGVDNDAVLAEVSRYGWELVIFYVVAFFLSFLSSFVMADVSQRYSQELRKEIEHKVNNLPLRYFDTNSTGDILSRLTNDVDMIAQSLQQSVSMLISSVLTIVAAIIAMFVTSWQMAFVALALLPLMVIFLIVILKIASP